MDAKAAFLLGKHSDREAPLFVMLPKGLEESLGASGPRRLHKAAYGLAEAPLAWFKVLRETLLACGFRPLVFRFLFSCPPRTVSSGKQIAGQLPKVL